MIARPHADNGDAMIITGDARNIDVSVFPQRYGVVVADPPWRYRQGETGSLQGRASAHYATMSDEEIYAMPISKLLANDAVLFLWGTWPKLPEAQMLMKAWGFEHVTGFPWVKLNRKNGLSLYYGVGYWVRGCSEYVLVGRRGSVSPPRAEGFLGLMSPNMQHSRKPDDIYQIAESLPGPYLELFARRSRDRWDSFGNEVEEINTGQIHTPNDMSVEYQPRLLV